MKLFISLKISSSLLLSFLYESNLNGYRYSVCIKSQWWIPLLTCCLQQWNMQEPAFLSGTTWLQPLGRTQLFPLSLWSGNPSISLSWSPESTQVHLHDGERNREILRSFSKFQYTLTSYQLFMRNFSTLHSINM